MVFVKEGTPLHLDLLDILSQRIEREITANQKTLERFDGDKIKRDSRQSYMIANGEIPNDDW